MITTADEIRIAALTRYGHEDGAAEDIAAGTPVILIDATWSGNALHILYGPALRLTDGTYLPAVELNITYGFMLKGRRGKDDTVEAAARRATAKALVGVTIPVEFSRGR